MIQLNELRIGNWIKFSNSECYVKIARHFFALDESDYSGYEPILITPELLQKAGFEKVSEGEYVYYNEKIDHSFIHSDCSGIEYLHKLQNLYFANTEDELQIDL